MTEAVKQCRSKSPDGNQCPKPRGHKKRHGESGREWTDGINKRAWWYKPDNGHMSEADYQTWGRFG